MVKTHPRAHPPGGEDLPGEPGARDLLRDGKRRDLLQDPGAQDLVRDRGLQDSLQLEAPPASALERATRRAYSPARSGAFAVARRRHRETKEK